jgi:hypothetical protein
MLMIGALWNHVVRKGLIVYWVRTGFRDVLFCRRRWWTHSKFLLNTVQQIHLHHAVWPPGDPFRSHISRSLFNGLPWWLLPVGLQCFGIHCNLSRGILFIRCNQFLLYSCILSITGVIFHFFAVCLFYNLSKCIPLFLSYNTSLLLLFFLCLLPFFNSPVFQVHGSVHRR